MKINESGSIGSGHFYAQVVKSNDFVDLIEKIVDVIEKKLILRLIDNKTKPLGLATGRTMEPVYTALVSRLLSWNSSDLNRLREGWCSFNLDEYIGLEGKDVNSFASYMNYYLATPLGLSPDKIMIPKGNAKDPSLEAKSYSKRLESLGGIGVQLLGLGVNGHIGFNEPPSGLETSCRVVSLAPETRRQNASSFNNSYDKVPSHAITLGIKEVLQADEIHLLVTGKSKADILKSLINSVPNDSLPASWLITHPNVYIWTDISIL